MGQLAMQIFENNDVMNSHWVAWRIRRFWLDVINCERLNSGLDVNSVGSW